METLNRDHTSRDRHYLQQMGSTQQQDIPSTDGKSPEVRLQISSGSRIPEGWGQIWIMVQTDGYARM